MGMLVLSRMQDEGCVITVPPSSEETEILVLVDLRVDVNPITDVKKRKVTVDVLAPHGRPAGATARVALVFTTTGDTKQRVTVHGRLFLSPDDHGSWQVFGYDVAKGGR